MTPELLFTIILICFVTVFYGFLKDLYYRRLIEYGRVQIKTDKEIKEEIDQKIAKEKQGLDFKINSSKFSFLIPLIIGLMISYFLLKYGSWDDKGIKFIFACIWILVLSLSFNLWKFSRNNKYQEKSLEHQVNLNSPGTTVISAGYDIAEFASMIFMVFGIINLVWSYLETKIVNSGGLFLITIVFLFFCIFFKINHKYYIQQYTNNYKLKLSKNLKSNNQ